MVRKWRGDQEGFRHGGDNMEFWTVPQGQQTWMKDNRQSLKKDKDPGPEYRQGQDQVPPPTPRLPYENHSPPVGCFMAPHRCPHCEDIPDNIFSLPPYSFDDPDPHPIMKTYFPQITSHSLT